MIEGVLEEDNDFRQEFTFIRPRQFPFIEVSVNQPRNSSLFLRLQITNSIDSSIGYYYDSPNPAIGLDRDMLLSVAGQLETLAVTVLLPPMSRLERSSRVPIRFSILVKSSDPGVIFGEPFRFNVVEPSFDTLQFALVFICSMVVWMVHFSRYFVISRA